MAVSFHKSICLFVVFSVNPIEFFFVYQWKFYLYSNNCVALISVNMSEKLQYFFFRTEIAMENYDMACCMLIKWHTWQKKIQLHENQQTSTYCIKHKNNIHDMLFLTVFFHENCGINTVDPLLKNKQIEKLETFHCWILSIFAHHTFFSSFSCLFLHDVRNRTGRTISLNSFSSESNGNNQKM